MPIFDGEGVFVRQAGDEKCALLARRCALWPGLWRAAQMRLPLLQEGLPSTGRVRRRKEALSASLRQD